MNFIDIFLPLISIILVFIFGIGILYVVNKITSLAHISSFLFSYFLLGCFTTMAEISVGIHSIIDDKDSVFVGNLIGGIIFLMAFLVPLIGVLSSEIKIYKSVKKSNLIYLLGYLVLPFLCILDNQVDVFDAVLLILGYVLISWKLSREDIDKQKITYIFNFHTIQKLLFLFLVLLFLVLGLMYVSNYVVDLIIRLSSGLGKSYFDFSFLLLPVITNMPEMIIALVSILKKQKNVAIGNYLGSATFSVFLIGVFSLFTGRIFLDTNPIFIFLFFLFMIVLIYYFLDSENKLTKKESFILLILSLLFFAIEIFI